MSGVELSADVEKLGTVLLKLLSTRGSWVHRRVDSVSFQDAVAFRRKVSVDFSIEPDWPTPVVDDNGAPIYYIPLGLLRKRKLVAFSLRDEQQRTLAMPTSSFTCEIAAASLIAAARGSVGRKMEEREHGSDLPPDIRADLRKIAVEKHASAAVGHLWNFGRQDSHSAQSRAWRAALVEDLNFMALAYDLARHFLIMVPLGLENGRRRVIKYSYEYRSLPEHLELPRWLAALRTGWFFITGGTAGVAAMRKGDAERSRIPFRDWHRIWLGWFPNVLTLDASAVFQGGNYHLEVEAPEGLQVTRAALYGKGRPEGKPLDIVRVSVQRVHLYAAGVGPIAYPEVATAVIKLRVRNETFIRAATMIAAVSSVLLLPLALFWREVTDTLSTVPSFLLVVPTALAAYVARSREPLATTERLFGLRLLAMSAGVWSFLAAVLLVVGRDCPRDTTEPCTSWGGTTVGLWVLAGLSLLTLGSLIRALTYGARPPEQKPQANVRPSG